MKTKLFIATFITGVSLTYATSGACSGHGGVDCTRIDWDSSVVCMDGWENSSVSYNSMVKCRGYNPKAPHATPPPVVVPIEAKPIEQKEVTAAKIVPVKKKVTTLSATSTVATTTQKAVQIPTYKQVKKNLFFKK